MEGHTGSSVASGARAAAIQRGPSPRQPRPHLYNTWDHSRGAQPHSPTAQIQQTAQNLSTHKHSLRHASIPLRSQPRHKEHAGYFKTSPSKEVEDLWKEEAIRNC